MNRIMTLTAATLALALAAPVAAGAQTVIEERGFPQAAERPDLEVTQGGYVGTTYRMTKERGYPQPASSDVEIGGFTYLDRNTADEGFDK
jgi:hypothetical protein